LLILVRANLASRQLFFAVKFLKNKFSVFICPEPVYNLFNLRF
jgi:hypothetical protein